MKSVVSFLSGYLDAMFNDIAPFYRRPSEWRRDHSRLRHELAHHGEVVLLLMLPALDRHFCKCLDQGLYVPSRLHLGGTLRVDSVPRFMRDLYLQVFDRQGKVLETPCSSAVVAIRQLLSGAKRLKVACSKGRISDELKQFIAVEQGLPHPSLHWDEDHLVREGQEWPRLSLSGCDSGYSDDSPGLPGLLPASDSGERPGWLDTLSAIADRVSSQFGLLDEVDELPRHGPGVVADAVKGSFKYDLPHWPRKLEGQYPRDWYGSPAMDYYLDPERMSYSEHEAPSRLIAVPKTFKGPRLIAAEPTSHQWIQQLLWQQLEARLPHTMLSPVIKFRSQVHNQRAARKGSIDGSLATIDLSSASDRLSCWLVERMFRTNPVLLQKLHSCRTRWLANRVDPSQWEYIRLKKFAPMGSAVTFPLQSIVYGAIAIAAVIYSRGQRVTKATIDSAANTSRVFGDDIIIPRDSTPVLIEMLTYCKLKVNLDKSFWTGRFRESCGSDWFAGEPVKPTYLSLSPSRGQSEDIPSYVEVSNNFHKAGWWRVADYLLSFTRRWQLPVTSMDSGSFGISSFCGDKWSHLRRRWNSDLQRDEYRALYLHSKGTVAPAEGRSILLQYFTERPSPTSGWKGGQRTSKAVLRLGWIPTYYTSPARNWSRGLDPSVG